MISVRIKGADELRRKLQDPVLADAALRPGFAQAAIIVEGQAKRKVHFITGKLQSSIGHVIEGRGWDLLARVGPQPGHDAPRLTARLGVPGARSFGKVHPQRRRAVNRGDPREYGWWEEKGNRYRPGHPFLEPALTDNLGRIKGVIAAAVQRALSRF